MGGRTGLLIAGATAVTLAAVALALSSRDPTSRGRRAARETLGRPVPAAAPRAPIRGPKEDCSTRSEANFPGAYTSPRNLVVGPLVLIGGAYTDAATVRDFGGNKFPLLVKAGHWVRVRIAQPGRRRTGLAYGLLPQHELALRDTHRSVTFVACRPGHAPTHYSPDGPSASRADGTAVTFWSGFVLTTAPACIALEIFVDGAPSPERTGLALGRRCTV
jgi:hypothetical protein